MTLVSAVARVPALPPTQPKVVPRPQRHWRCKQDPPATWPARPHYDAPSHRIGLFTTRILSASDVFAGGSPWNAMNSNSSFSVNVRIACIAIAAYDFVITIPAEWRIYRSAWRRNCISVPAILFIFIRYISVLLSIFGSYLFWGGDNFSESLCRGFLFLPVFFKCLQATVVQLILGWRTYKISRRNKRVLYTLTILHVLVVPAQWFSSFFDRHMSRLGGHCSWVNVKYDVAWGFYFCSSVWDVTTLVISLWFLLRIKTSSPLISKLARTMLVDGLLYFLAMTAFNVANMVIFLNSSQPARNGSVVVAYTATWILGQRILINLNDSAMEKRATATFPTQTVTVVVGDTSAEGLSREVSTRLRSARHQTGPTIRSYRQRLEGTIQSSSGGYLDSFITLDIKPQDSSAGGEGDGTLNGESMHPTRSGDPPGRTADHETGRRPSEGLLMATRRF